MAIYVSLINSYALGAESPFEAAIDLLNPLAWYRFRDTDFATAIEDSSGNNYDLTKQIATAARSAVPTRITHPGGAYFPAVTYDNWATLGTFYKGTTGLLSGATEYTLLVSFRMIAAPSTHISKAFGIGTEAVAETGNNDLMFFRASNSAPTNPHYVKHRTTSGGLIPVDFTVTELLQDGVNRLMLVRYKRSTPLFSMSSSKPGHLALTEESVVATSGTGLEALSRALILNARSEAGSGPDTTTGMVIDQIAVWASDIGATAEADLHSKWSDELAGYYPSMMQFDGSTGYYTLLNYSTSGNLVSGVIRFNRSSFTGGTTETLCRLVGNANRERFAILLYASDHATAGRRNKLEFRVQEAAAGNLCRLFSTASMCDGEDHVVRFSFSGDAGTAVFVIDGAADDDLANAERVAPTAGTIDSGASSDLSVGATAGGANKTAAKIGFFGYRDAYLTNWSDFMNGNQPLPIDEKNWTEFGGVQPAAFSHTGQMDNNKGSAGDMTKNGTITMTTGGSP